MRIAYVTIEDLTKTTGGKVHFWAVASELAKLNNSVDIVAPRYSSALWNSEAYLNVALMGWRVPSKGPLGLFCFELILLLLLPWLRTRRGWNTMLVRGGGVSVLMGLVFLLARLLRIRVVLECNGVAWEEFRSRGYPRWYCFLVRLMAWQQAATCNAIIGVTPAIRDAYCQLGGKSNGYAISNGVFTEKIPVGARDAIREEQHWNENHTIFLMPSEFAPWHATRAVVEAVGMLSADERNDMRFVLPGSGEEFNDIRRLVSQLQLDSIIDLPGRLEREKIYRLLGAADVGLFLIADRGKLRYPGSPLKLFEYLGAGLETIVSADSYHSKLIPYYELGSVIEAATPEHIAAALRYHSSHPTNEARRRHIRQIAESEFHWRQVARRVLAVLLGNAPELEQWQVSVEPHHSGLALNV